MISISGSRRGHKRQHSSSESSVNVEDEEDTETINEKFRRGKNLEGLGLDWGNNSEKSDDSHDSENSNDKLTEEANDSEWNMLGAALEKEFLEN